MRVKSRSTTPMCAERGRDKAANLRQQDDQRRLAHIGRFARHIGAGDDGNLAALQPELGIIGDEQRTLQHLLHHRMAAVEDFDLAGQIDRRALYSGA